MKNWLAKCILLAAALLTVPFTLRADSFADTGDDAIVAVPLTTYSYTIDFGSTPTYVTPQLVMSNLGISRLWGNAVWNSPDGEDNGATELDRKGGNAELVSGDWDGVTLFIKGDFITLGGTWYMSGSNGARGGDGGDVVGSGPRAGEGGNASGGGNGGSLLVTTRRLGIDTSQQGHFSFVSDGGDGGEGGAGGNAWGDFDCPGGGAIKALGGDGGNGADGGDNGVLYVQTCYPLSNEQLEYLSSMTVTSGDGGDGGLAGGPLQVSIASYGDPAMVETEERWARHAHRS
jgi:hypothetical protein